MASERDQRRLMEEEKEALGRLVEESRAESGSLLVQLEQERAHLREVEVGRQQWKLPRCHQCPPQEALSERVKVLERQLTSEQEVQTQLKEEK